jgi:leader peptidase (prepilin peptidase)/N-methyltransferase
MAQAILYALIYNGFMLLAAGSGWLIGGPTGATVVIGGCLGAAVGSFLNLVVHRLRAGIPIHGAPSHCPRCQVPIRDRHNVPVFGWLWLRGRCAACGNPISWHYPLVELLVGAVGAVLAVALLAAVRDGG